jgi:16S rRNA (uracil1498-N3)-methyltransferase
MFCDESLAAAPAARVLAEAPRGPWAVLVGPEGGFAPEEQARLRALPFARAVTLGPRILRADTAAVAALALWQAALGDWG